MNNKRTIMTCSVQKTKSFKLKIKVCIADFYIRAVSAFPFSLLNVASACSRENNPAVVTKLSHPIGATNSPTEPKKFPPFSE